MCDTCNDAKEKVAQSKCPFRHLFHNFGRGFQTVTLSSGLSQAMTWLK